MSHLAVPLKLTQHCKSTIFQLKKKKSVLSDQPFVMIRNFPQAALESLALMTEKLDF